MGVGFGSDLSCPGKLFTGRMVGGVRLLAESVLRRLSTPRGTLDGGAEESAYGLDLAGYVGAVGTTVAQAALPGVIESELLKDARIAAVSVVVAHSTTAGTTTFENRIRVTPANELGDFSLTLAVDDVTVSVLGGMPG